MKTRGFSFKLPEHLIAQTPADKRSMSRLMVLNRENKSIIHTKMNRIVDYLPRDTFMVINNSKVRKARLYGTLDSGIPLEVLFLNEEEDSIWAILSNKTKRLKKGRIVSFPGNIKGEVIESREGEDKKLKITPFIDESFFTKYGHVPLPPYIQRGDLPEDIKRYQTVYAEKIGSVAAPTAGLHFTKNLLNEIKNSGIDIFPVTLHVGAGTFLPIRTERVEDHTMHYETYEISPGTASAIMNRKKSGGKLLAVGTTSVRTLEAASSLAGKILPGKSRTNLFITPGYTFKTIDHMLTNFHTPESTLLILASAFAGYDFIMHAYHEAVKNEYRFFSYGDAMLII
ncbi:MAG: tRNA preQ1(34) S-adenosylmethionine ribosyltransferase-isomerase QueA [Spirochaetales bacterium]|nr:tRNA preQ1(34) S-adenosylmethionine ribosyltransferase-isomerase QueA [Spirochaetales bacterium]